MVKAVTHGHCRGGDSRTYISWRNMVYRCTSPRHSAYPYYGGKGVKVAPEWREFEGFLRDMGKRPDGHTIDRINVEGHYEPGNCRWATREVQYSNRTDNIKLTLNGVTLCASQWATELGMNRYTLYARLDAGWSHEKALTTPVRPLRRRAD